MSTEPSTTRRGRPGYDRDSLLVAAVEVVTSRGWDATSMEDLARALGVTKAALYHHVSSREELLGLALDHALEPLEAAADRAAGDDGRAVDRVERLVRDSVMVLCERLGFVTLLLRVRANTAVEAAALDRRRALDMVAADIVAQAVTEGDLRSDIEPVVAARLVFGTVNSLVEWYRPDGDLAPDALADLVTAVALDGLRA